VTFRQTDRSTSVPGRPALPGANLWTDRADRRAAIDELQATAERIQPTVLESFEQVADVLDTPSQDAANLSAQSRALAVAQNRLELSRES
jgi:hypothetical protein